MASTVISRTELLQLEEQKLLEQCRCETCRGTGPGGQKRNKTSSAVHLTHLATGLSAYDDVERSQQVNKHHALQKLRMEIAFNLRESAVPWTDPVPGQRTERYALYVASLLDSLYEHNFSLAETAAAFGSTTGRLVRELAKTPSLWQLVNRERVARGFSQLRQS